MTVHFIGLLGTSDSVGSRLAADAAAYYSFCQPIPKDNRDRIRFESWADQAAANGATSTFLLLTGSKLREYDGFNTDTGSFAIGDYATDRMAMPAPPEHSGFTEVVQPVSRLRSVFLQSVEATARTMQPGIDRLFIAFFTRVDVGDDVVLGLGDGSETELLSPRDVDDALRMAGNNHLDVTLWNPNGCLGGKWTNGDFGWSIMTTSRAEPDERFLRVPWMQDTPRSLSAPQFGHPNTPAPYADRDRLSTQNLLSSLTPTYLTKLIHPAPFLSHSVDETLGLPALWPPWRANLSYHIGVASSTKDLDALGDKFAYRLECVLTLYLFCIYGPWRVPKSETYASLEQTPYRLYSFLRFEMASISESGLAAQKTLEEFLDTTDTNLPHLCAVAGTETIMHGTVLSFHDALQWMAAKWVEAGRPPFDMASLAFIRLWRFSNVRESFTPLLRYLAEVWEGDVDTSCLRVSDPSHLSSDTNRVRAEATNGLSTV